eukprot:gene15963-31091_t
MGCGSSKLAAQAGHEERNRIALILSSHIAAILDVAPVYPDVQQYVTSLLDEGFHAPEDFDDLTIDALKADPLNFKPGHLKKVARSRQEATVRGKCRLCGLDVLDSQPRAKDPATGRYQHQDCRASNGATPPPLSNTTPSASSNVHEVAVSDAKASAAQTAEDARLEVAAIKAAADAARAEVVAETNRVVAEANRQAEAALAQARSNMMQINSATPQSTATTLQHGAARDHQNTSVSRGTISLPAEPKTKRPLLPDGKHAFLSYQWDVQEQADRGDSALGEADAAITLNKLTLEEARGWVKEARDGTNVDDLEATTLADATEDLTEDEAIAVALPAILHTAVEDGDDDTIIALLDGRADPNVQNVATNGTTPLYVAAQNGHLAAVVALLDKNADPNLACTEDGSTPLLMAADGEVGTGSDDGGSSFSKAGWGQGIARNALPDPGLISGWGNKAASDRNFGVAKLTPMPAGTLS